jgi:hypothetical protein
MVVDARAGAIARVHDEWRAASAAGRTDGFARAHPDKTTVRIVWGDDFDN